MECGYHAAFTALLAGTQALELAANNLANISTAGYKAQRGGLGIGRMIVHHFSRKLQFESGSEKAR